MAEIATINQISKEIEYLDYNGKLDILSRIVSMLAGTKEKPVDFRLTDLKGLGKEHWRKINVNEYIEKERDSWD